MGRVSEGFKQGLVCVIRVLTLFLFGWWLGAMVGAGLGVVLPGAHQPLGQLPYFLVTAFFGAVAGGCLGVLAAIVVCYRSLTRQS